MPPTKKRPTVGEKPAAKVEDVKAPEAPEAPAPVVDEAELEAQQRYEEALAAGLSDDEAREIGWPSAGANPGDAAPLEAEVEATGDEPEVEAETGMVDEPCRKCFPDGWPVQEFDAFANCAHGFGIRYGDQIEITRERAIELGFLSEEE